MNFDAIASEYIPVKTILDKHTEYSSWFVEYSFEKKQTKRINHSPNWFICWSKVFTEKYDQNKCWTCERIISDKMWILCVNCWIH